MSQLGDISFSSTVHSDRYDCFVTNVIPPGVEK